MSTSYIGPTHVSVYQVYTTISVSSALPLYNLFYGSIVTFFGLPLGTDALWIMYMYLHSAQSTRERQVQFIIIADKEELSWLSDHEIPSACFYIVSVNHIFRNMCVGNKRHVHTCMCVYIGWSKIMSRASKMYGILQTFIGNKSRNVFIRNCANNHKLYYR